MDLTATVYSDEASMANGSNGESTLLMVTPQIVEEPETGLVPQAQAQPVAGLFGDQRIFVNAPQYHWHVQGAVGTDNEARQHIVALAQRLHQFGHRTEERELELWHRLSNVAEVPGVERRLATAQERWESEYNKFIAELSNFVNKETNDFRSSIVVMSESLRDVRVFNTQNREAVQATSQRMESVHNQVTSIRSDLKEQIERCGVAQYFGQRETRTQRYPQRKDYIINKQNRLNAPGYIARTWAHYNTLEGPHSHDKCHSSECKLYKPIPNQTPMHLGRCHSCASQRHPDTMHNITPPHKGAAALRRTKNGKESQQKKIKSRNH